MPLLEHLVELRRRLMWSIVGVHDLASCVCYYFSSRIYFFLAEPLANVLREQGNPDPHLIYTQLYEAFFTRIKVAFFGGAFIGVPDHRQPDLAVRRARPVSQREARAAAVPGGDAGAVPCSARRSPTISCSRSPGSSSPASRRRRAAAACRSSCCRAVSEYLDLVMKLIFAFGITFELPVLLTLLAKVGIVSSKGLKRFRRYAYVGMFVSPRSWPRPTSSPRPASRCR